MSSLQATHLVLTADADAGTVRSALDEARRVYYEAPADALAVAVRCYEIARSLSDADVRSSGLGTGTFLGEPKALGYLAFTEAWERFSFYGMSALLVLYLTQALLLPGHVEHIQGFTAFRAGLERLFGPLSTVALASQIYGLYSGFVYFTPVLGGWLAG